MRFESVYQLLKVFTTNIIVLQLVTAINDDNGNVLDGTVGAAVERLTTALRIAAGSIPARSKYYFVC